MAQGEYNHIEIPADDPGRAQRFYEGVFGWGFTEVEGFPDYFIYRSGPGEMGGAIGKRGESAGPVLRAYVLVDAIDAALVKVTELGGTTTLGRTDVPGQGWYAVVNDSEGNEIGLWEQLPA